MRNENNLQGKKMLTLLSLCVFHVRRLVLVSKKNLVELMPLNIIVTELARIFM